MVDWCVVMFGWFDCCDLPYAGCWVNWIGYYGFSCFCCFLGWYDCWFYLVCFTDLVNAAGFGYLLIVLELLGFIHILLFERLRVV